MQRSQARAWIWLDIHQARKHCNVSYSTIYRAVRAGDLTPNGTTGKLLFRPADLDAWLESRAARKALRMVPPAQVLATAAALLVLFVFGVGCDVGAKSCHANHHHYDRE